MKATITIALILATVTGCTHTDSDAIPTFNANENWAGKDSPVLTWNPHQRQALLDAYAPLTHDILTDAGLTTTPPPNATAVDALQRAQAIGDSVPRPVRELTLLTTAQAHTGITPTPTTEAAMLDTAWNTCTKLTNGETYAQLAYNAAANYDPTHPDTTSQNTLAATLYAPIICPTHTTDALTTIAGIDGIDSLTD